MTDDTHTTGERTMKDVSHTNPYTDEPFGDACAFERGPVVAADGGSRDEADGVSEPSGVTEPTGIEEQTMKDVSHTPPHADAGDVNRVFERGTEGRDETV